MNRFLLTLMAVVMVAGSSFARNAWGPVVSYWDTADESDDIGFGAFFSFDVAANVAFDLRASWFNDIAARANRDLEVIPLEAGVQFFGRVGDIGRIHLGGGLGYYIINGEVQHGDWWERDFDPDDEIGGYLSAGVEIVLVGNMAEGLLTRGITLFADAGYRYISSSDGGTGSDFDPRLEDDALSGVMANAGIRFLW